MNHYDAPAIEKMAGNLGERWLFCSQYRSQQTKILCAGNVSLSVWPDTYGACAQLYAWRCCRPLPARERI